jgi:hypothetical protein
LRPCSFEPRGARARRSSAILSASHDAAVPFTAKLSNLGKRNRAKLRFLLMIFCQSGIEGSFPPFWTSKVVQGGGKVMVSECVACGGKLQERDASCPRCEANIGAPAAPPTNPQRKRLSIPFATILAVGFAGALAFGAGKGVPGHAASSALVSASVDGKTVPIDAPELSIFERQLRGSRRH